MGFYGLLNLPWWGYILVALITTHITALGITLFLHRSQAHSAVKFHPAVNHFFRFWLWFFGGMKTKEWVAVHRKHHATCETDEDPHSPVTHGLKTILFEGAEMYRRAKKDPKLLEKYGKGTPDDWLEKHVYSTPFLRGKLGVLMLYVLCIVLLGIPGIIVFAYQMAWTPFYAAGIINGVGHFFGYRNFQCQGGDNSRNILPIGILIAGEELHNNHHAYGTSAKFSVKWWEFDIGWMYIKLLSFFGLAEPRRTIPKAKMIKNKTDVDLDTIKSIIRNKLHLVFKYNQLVIKKTIKDDNTLNTKRRRASKLLTTDPGIMTDQDIQAMNQILQNNATLKTCYDALEKLKSIWLQPATNNQTLIDQLKQWCSNAEHSGIAPLQNFSSYLKSYHVA